MKNRYMCVAFLLLLLTVVFAQIPKVSHIYPNAGTNDQVITAHVYGDTFTIALLSVRLIKAGYPDINGTAINVISDDYLTCLFDLTDNATGVYDLVVENASGSDTLPRCFTVYSASLPPYLWEKTTVGSGNITYGVAVGDGNGDGEMELYGADYDRTIYQCKWNGASWDKTVLGSGTYSMYGVAVGDGNGDGEMEVYGGGIDYNVYQFKWNGTSWDQTIVGSCNYYVFAVAVGDGNGDGEMEVYGTSTDSNIYQFKWNGSSWDGTAIGAGTMAMDHVTVGDGNEDGELEVYGSNMDDNIYQFKWNGVTWDKTTVGSGGDLMYGVAVGDGNGDGEREVYGSNYDYNVYQFKWNGVSWDRTTVGSGTDQMRCVTTGDGNGDGEHEVYSGSYDYNLYQFKWNGTSWDSMTVGTDGQIMWGTRVGDGNNDGWIEIYSASGGTIHQFKLWAAPDIALSDTYYIFPHTAVGDSTDWEDLVLTNTGGYALFIDSATTQTNNYIVIDPVFPDTITENESTYVTVRFKPSVHGECNDTLRFYSNDPDEPVVEVKLYATATDTFPPMPFSLISPPDSAVLGIPRPLFVWESSFDSIGGILHYEIFIDDTLRNTGSDTTWGADYHLPQMWHTWFVVAHDYYGNSQQSNEVWSLLIDMTEPVVESTTVWHDTSYTGPFEISTRAIDDLSGIDSVVLYYWRDEDSYWADRRMHQIGSTDWYVDTIPPVSQSDDSVRYYVRAFDQADPPNSETDPPGAPASYYGFIANYTGIMENKNIPKVFAFRLVSNPMRGRVAFALALPSAADVTLRIYDAIGRLVDTPITGRQAAGFYDVVWTADVSTGIYFYTLESPWERKTGKLILVK